jgi:hypothetical protein
LAAGNIFIGKDMMINDELELIKDIAARLDKAGIEYMMTGSMALALYAVPRMTRDIDIIVNIPAGDSSRIVALFQDDFYVDEASVRQALRDKGMFNIIHNDTVIKVDIIIRKDEEYRIEEFSRKRRINIENVAVSVVAPEDLVLSKLVWAKRSGSELQFLDARQMLRTLHDMDSDYVRTWAKRLGIDDLVRKAYENE